MKKNTPMSAATFILPAFFFPFLSNAQDLSLAETQPGSMPVTSNEMVEFKDDIRDESAKQKFHRNEEPPFFQLFNRKSKPKKYKYKFPQRSHKPSTASTNRLKCQSKRARKSMNRNLSRHLKHRKATWKRQKEQKSYSSRKNHFIHKPSRSDERTKIRKVYRMDNKGK
jgi:hypothetical protein